MNDEELEQTMRTGLRGKAGEVDVGSEYADRARKGARARRRTKVGLAAVAAAVPVVDLDCDPGALPALDTVVLRFHGQSEDADVLARLDGCGGYYTEGGGTRLFTRANVTPWVVDGVGLYASGGQVGNAISGRYDGPGD